MHFERFFLPEGYEGTPAAASTHLEEKIQSIKTEITSVDNKIIKTLEDRKDDFLLANQVLYKFNKVFDVRKYAAATRGNRADKKVFYIICGWLTEKDAAKLSKELENEPETFCLSEKDLSKVLSTPPIKLKNNALFKPFEMFVEMYGLPNYKEFDPTILVGITYSILFGFMFGDVGQGLVFIVIGFLLSPKKKPSPYGEILKRIGVSSTIFGFLYGSIFGLEEVIPALLVRPMENINQVLYTAIGFGVVLLLISFGMSMYNLGVEGKKDEMIFGNHGFAGLAFYIALLVGLLQTVLGSNVIPSIVLVVVSVIALGMILLRVPLYAMMNKEKPHYEEGKSSYYIEGGFNLIETILSFLSNTISFIRVGAFALNHVGLFLAFTTMANMVNNKAIGIFIMVLGNIIIIGLEGLIVLIQGLRLEYYELFGKYFKGDGRAFVPVTFIEKEGEI